MSGLEIFEEAEVLHLEHPERFGEDFYCGFGRKYIVRNLEQEEIFQCRHDVSKAPLCFRSHRYVNCPVYDKEENEIIRICSSQTDTCCAGCCHATVDVTVAPNRKLGSISTVTPFRKKKLVIRDANGKDIYRMRHARSTFFKNKFKVFDIQTRKMVGRVIKNLLSDGDLMQRFIVEYMEPISADDKILIFSSLFLLEMKAFRVDGDDSVVFTCRI